MEYENAELVLLVVGATLAVIGGTLGKVIDSSLERNREVRFIKIGLKSDLNEIIDIISACKDTFNNSSPKQVSKKYISQLQSYTEVFKEYRLRMFLVKKDTRKKVFKFYRDLDAQLTDHAKKAGTLSPSTPASLQEQQAIMTDLNNLSNEARELRNKLKIKILWFEVTKHNHN